MKTIFLLGLMGFLLSLLVGTSKRYEFDSDGDEWQDHVESNELSW